MEEAVTLVQVQQVADADAASASSSLEKRFEAKFDAVTQDFDALKVNSTEQSLGIKALLQLSKNQTAAAPAVPQYQQYQQYQQPPYQQQPAPAQNASQYQQPYARAPQQQYYGPSPGGKGGGKGGKGWRGTGVVGSAQ